METNLFVMCMSSFAAVFLVLTFLAVAMRLIIVVFPEKEKDTGIDEAAVYAAISSTYARLYPGTRIRNIEEIKKQD